MQQHLLSCCGYKIKRARVGGPGKSQSDLEAKSRVYLHFQDTVTGIPTLRAFEFVPEETRRNALGGRQPAASVYDACDAGVVKLGARCCGYVYGGVADYSRSSGTMVVRGYFARRSSLDLKSTVITTATPAAGRSEYINIAPYGIAPRSSTQPSLVRRSLLHI
jgi:hypothetical protein